MQFLFSPPQLLLRRGRSFISRKVTEKGKNCDQRYGAAFILGEKIDQDLSLLQGDDEEKEHDENKVECHTGEGTITEYSSGPQN